MNTQYDTITKSVQSLTLLGYGLDTARRAGVTQLYSEDGTCLTLQYMSGAQALESCLRSRGILPPQSAVKSAVFDPAIRTLILGLYSGQTINLTEVPQHDIRVGQKITTSLTASEQSLASGSTNSNEGKKADDGKAPWHLVPVDAMTEIVDVLNFGALKYGERNWENGIKYSRVFSAAMRHMWAWWMGEDNDPESGKSHLAHAGCCVLFALHFSLNGKYTDFDNRVKQE